MAQNKNIKEVLKDITTLIFDVDGVLTNGQVLLLPNGDKVRELNSKDAFALQLAVKSGLNVAIITGGTGDFVKEALQGLGISSIYTRVSNKLDVFKDYVSENNLKVEECLYMGDDMPDFWVMEQVALPCCPADAASDIKAISIYISQCEGGKGAVRDIVEQVLRVKGLWHTDAGKVW